MENPNQIITIAAGNENCYVLVNDKTAILIDTCSKKVRELVYERIKEFPIELIILTHGHYDHIENAKYFSDKFSAKIAMAPEDIELIKNPLARKICPRNFSGRMMLARYKKHVKRNKIDEFQPDILLHEDFGLYDYGFDAKIISLPGHTKGSIAVVSASGAAIVGDTLMSMPNPTTALISENIEACNKDVDRLRDLSLLVAYSGHGRKINARIWLTKENELANSSPIPPKPQIEKIVNKDVQVKDSNF